MFELYLVQRSGPGIITHYNIQWHSNEAFAQMFVECGKGFLFF